MNLSRLNFVFLFLIVVLSQSIAGWSEQPSLSLAKKHYMLLREPIDVVIPCADKDIETLELCIEGIRQNGKDIRRIIVVSPDKLTEKAEWFDEKNYPFTKFDLALQILGSEEGVRTGDLSRLGWVYQQFLKLYAPLIIPHISSNVLMLDSDTIFLNPVEFLGPSGEGLYNIGNQHYMPYFHHATRLIPGFQRVFPEHSGICHHMLFQRAVIEDLFAMITSQHQMEPWKAICHCVDTNEFNMHCMSEYEIYFNFIFLRTGQMQIRPLRWKDWAKLNHLVTYKQQGLHYVSCHHYSRNW